MPRKPIHGGKTNAAPLVETIREKNAEIRRLRKLLCSTFGKITVSVEDSREFDALLKRRKS